jgi:predicted alpha/beta-hydrolase family hydrolase
MPAGTSRLRSEVAHDWIIGFGSHEVSVRLDAANDDAAHSVLVLAHGAGGHMADRGMTALAELFGGRGLDVVRFNFPYAEHGSRRPDPMPLLQQCIMAVVASARDRFGAMRWIIGGRSMGGRAASMLAAEGFSCDGLLLLAYPLHPAGAPEKLRDAHLARITVPVLCLNGTRDSLCRRDLMDAVVARLSSSFRMHWLDGADHSFHVPKASGRSDAEVLNEIGDATQRWLAAPSARPVRRNP